MIYRMFLLWSLTAGLMAQSASVIAAPVGTAFTYQGQLQEDDGSPVSDPTCDFTFELWADEVSVDPGDLKGTESKDAVGMTDGLFTVSLDFGRLMRSPAMPAGWRLRLAAPRDAARMRPSRRGRS